MSSPGSGGNALGRLIRWVFLAAWVCVSLGLLLISCGVVLLPVAGWGAAYVFAAGLWMLAAAALPAVTLLVSAIIFRVRYSRWYFGAGKLLE